MKPLADLIGRLLLGFFFLLPGIRKISSYAGSQGYMEAMGVPGMLLPLVILLEIGAGLALIVGWQTRWAALALAGFSALAAILFHANFSDQTQMVMFMKNWAIAGGLLVVAVHGAGEFSLDRKLSKSSG